MICRGHLVLLWQTTMGLTRLRAWPAASRWRAISLVSARATIWPKQTRDEEKNAHATSTRIPGLAPSHHFHGGKPDEPVPGQRSDGYGVVYAAGAHLSRRDRSRT